MTTIENEVEHYATAERLIERAQAALDNNDCGAAALLTAMAGVHAQLSVAADHDRLAGCVPDGGSAIRVATR